MKQNQGPAMDESPELQQLEDLRQQLRQAEEVCAAIQAGEVDAVVVGRSDEQKRVLLMSGSYSRYRQIVEDMLQGAVTITPAGEILFANHAFAAMVGESVLNVLRTPLARWMAGEDQPRLAAFLKSYPGPRDLTVTLQRGDARVHTLLSLVSASDDFVTLLVTPVAGDADASATLEAIRNGLVDAFVVKGTQVRLLDSAQAPYRVMVENMQQGAITLDPDHTIVYANERFAAMAALPTGRLRGTPLLDLVPTSHRHAVRTLLAGREPVQGEMRLLRANGDSTALNALVLALEGHKLVLFTDHTERKRHEAADERTRKFLGMLAHEFRNIIGPIANSTDLIKRTQALDAEGRKAIELMERQSARLLALVEDLRRVNPTE
jgi:PAS domain S-box-containing protein